MSYSSPYLLFLGALVAIFWTVDYFKLFKRAELQIPQIETRKSWYRHILKYALFVTGIIGWISITHAIMGPRMALNFKPATIEVNDIYVIVDVSRSMLTTDYVPNRVEVAKKSVSEFVALRPSDRIAVIIFADKPFTFLPLTTDLDLVSNMVNEIKVGPLGSGTAMGDAIGLAIAKADRSDATHKVIVLLTDGVNNVGNLDPIPAANLAKEKNIKIYAIAIGNDPDAKLDGYAIVPGGSFDLKTLNTIAAMTGGKTYFAKDRDALSNCLSEINQLEKGKIEIESRVVFKEMYFLYLLAGALLVLFVDIMRRTVLREIL